jgi:prophage maintenance system killer protein/prophage antirepressor-like protein
MIKKVSQTPIIYQTKSGALELRGDFRDETLWATQAQIADLFEIDRTVVTKHINNIIKSGEVAKSNVQKMHIANSDKPVAFYSLDIILSVGYRSNSDRAITFRKWATKVLREHMIDGYTVNKTRIAQNYTAFLQAVDDIKKFLPEGGQVDAGSVLELVTAFADTWFSLDAYDREALVMTGATHQEVTLTVRELAEALKVFRQALIEKGEATEFFGREKDTSGIASIVANVMQSFGEDDVYPTLEEKAAHLLYFTVKNHPFIDGNKRSGAYAFVWFLQATGII